MVTTIYADAFGFIYDDFDGMCRAYANVPNAMNLEHSRDKRIKLCKDFLFIPTVPVSSGQALCLR